MRETDEKSKFDRILSQRDVVALAFGAMIGWGWVVLCGEWIETAGSVGASIAFVAGGFMIFFIALTYAELTAALPKCGGEQVFSLRGLGYRASFICTWALILGYVSVVSFEAVAFPTVVQYLVPGYVKGYMYTLAEWDVYATWVAAGVIGSIVLTITNYIGIKPAAFLQSVFVVIIAVVGIIFMIGAFTMGKSEYMQPLFLEPMFPEGIAGIIKVAAMTPFMYVGFDVVPQAAEEINMPFNKLGKVLLLSVGLGVVWYVMIILGVSRALTHQETQTSILAAADAMKAVYFKRDIASTIMIMGGIAGIITSWNSFFIGGSRAMYAMADSGMLPKFLAKLHPKYKTPSNAILLIGIISSIAPFFGRRMLVWLSNAGAATVVLAYAIVVISFLALRKNEPDLERPYVVKNGRLVATIAFSCCALMLIMVLPGMPGALQWPFEWGILIFWTLFGVALTVFQKVTEKGKR